MPSLTCDARPTSPLSAPNTDIITLHFSRSLIDPLKSSVIARLHFECSVPYRPNLPFLISDIRALWRSAPGTLALRAERQSARMSEIKNGRLGLYGKA